MRSLPRVMVAWAVVVLAAELAAQTAAQAPKGARRQAIAQAGQATPWWQEIDTGPFISDTFLFARDGEVAALKGIAVKVGAAGEATMIFDTELLAWRVGFDGSVVLEGTPWNGSHGGNSHVPAGEGRVFFANAGGVGVARDGSWADTREPKSGPLPREVGRYRGLYRHGRDVVLQYTVGGVMVWERPALEMIGGVRALTRTVEVAATSEGAVELLVRNARTSEGGSDARLKPDAAVFLVGASSGVELKRGEDGRATVAIARGTGATRFKIVYAERALSAGELATAEAPRNLAPLTRGGPALWSQTFAVKGQLDANAATKTYAVDVVPLPSENPWKAPPRLGGFDFLPGGKRVAASTWNGDVWIAEGIDGDLAEVTWRRFASGMFQTLGLKVVDGVIYTQGRDQITRLHDLNGDGEADYYECFNNEVRITAGFHEFSFDLETDREGNFYFSKGMPVNQGGRGFMPWTPHNGTVIKVSNDGAKLEVVAWGLRAPGGVGVSPDGVITTGENEGSWVPQCKITWTPPGKPTFNGVVPGKWVNRGTWEGPLPGAPTDYDRPLCWLPYQADNSSGSQAWVPANTGWDPRHAGEMLHLSYGKSSIFRVLREEVNGVVQGGVYRLPIDVSAAVMRARFHPQNGHLYVAGFRGWQTNGRDAFQRVRYTGVTVPQPVGLQAHANGVLVRFSAPLDRKTAEDPARYSVSKWNYVWGPQYGSGRFSIDQRDAEAEARALTVPSKGAHNQVDTVAVGAAKLVEDGRAVFLYLPKMTTAMQMELKLDVSDPQSAPVRETIYSTVHATRGAFEVPGVRWEDIRIADTAPAGERGLVMTFDAETTDTVRVDQLALTVPDGAAPSVFVSGSRRGEPFAVSWQGTLLVPERDEYVFSLEGAGTATLRVGGKVIATGELPLTGKAPVALAKGAHAIFASYRAPREGEARVRLMWSSPQFRTEPVPASAFRHFPGAELELWSKVRAGRDVFLAAQCVTCHQPRGGLPRDGVPELFATPPDLKAAGSRFDPAWLEKWIAAPAGHCPTVVQTADDASDVAAYLIASGRDGGGGAATGSLAGSANGTELAQAGAELVEKLHLAPWVEPLTRTRKHTEAGLFAFLREPTKHHADTVFPDLRLTADEAVKIAAFVRSRQPAAEQVPMRGNVARGKAMFAAACAACHVVEDDHGRDARAAVPSFETMARGDWTVRGCVAENRGRAPDLRLTAEQRALLVAFRNADRDVGLASLRRFAPAEYATAQVKALRCAECHSGTNKLPEMALAGEKFERAWLEQLLAGKHGTKTRPWLEARMPAFASRAANLATGLAAKHGVPIAAQDPARMKPELAVVGEKLAGTEGYSCIACHDAGTRKALQVFEGQGPNLAGVPGRLRQDYYHRWMHWPQRIAPTTPMPRYTKDRDHAVNDSVASGNAEQQFDAIWSWIAGLKRE